MSLTPATAIEAFAGDDVPNKAQLGQLVVDCLPDEWQVAYRAGEPVPATQWLVAVVRALALKKAVLLQLDSVAFATALAKPGSEVRRTVALAAEAQNTQLVRELSTQVRLIEEMAGDSRAPQAVRADGQAVEGDGVVPFRGRQGGPRGRSRAGG